MDDKEVVLITGIYAAVVILIAVVMLAGGAYIEAHLTTRDSGFVLSKERALWETNM